MGTEGVRTSSVGYINLGVVARCGRIHGGDNKLDVRLQFRLLLLA
jgi:hypothetical protein